MPLLTSNFMSVCSARVSQMTDSVDHAWIQEGFEQIPMRTRGDSW